MRDEFVVEFEVGLDVDFEIGGAEPGGWRWRDEGKFLGGTVLFDLNAERLAALPFE